MKIPRQLAPGLFTYSIAYLAFLYLPILFLPLFSFNSGSIMAFPLQGFTLKWYRQLDQQETLIQALGNSLIVGGVTAIVSTSIGLFAARAYVWHIFPGKKLSEGLVMLPLIIPAIIVASSMLILFVSMGLKPSLATIILGHIFVALPFSVLIMKSAFDQFDQSLEEAAYDLGETVIGTFRRIILPIMTPGIIASILITFTVSLDEFVLAFFLSGNEPTLPVYIWSQIRFPAKLPNTLALGSLLLFFSIFLLVVAEQFRKRTSQNAN